MNNQEYQRAFKLIGQLENELRAITTGWRAVGGYDPKFRKVRDLTAWELARLASAEEVLKSLPH